jgi:hypothetical protein
MADMLVTELVFGSSTCGIDKHPENMLAIVVTDDVFGIYTDSSE